MTIGEVLKTTRHRPWALPPGNWTYYQEWNRTLFLHWQVDELELKKFVPAGLEIDLFEGKPWVSLVAFTMENIRPRLLPAFPPVSNFEEINVRTYVKSGSKTGVYFLSIEGSKRLSCFLAKTISGLPYRHSAMKRSNHRYQSANAGHDDRFDVTYSPGKAVQEKTPLDRWLTERYALFQDIENAIQVFEIHHLEWPVQQVEVERLTLNYPRFSYLLQGIPHLVHYSKGVNVLAWEKKKMEP